MIYFLTVEILICERTKEASGQLKNNKMKADNFNPNQLPSWPATFCVCNIILAISSTILVSQRKFLVYNLLDFFCQMTVLKFIYSEKATKFCEISTLLLSYAVPVKSNVEISQKNFLPSQNKWTLKHSATKPDLELKTGNKMLG